ncbi:alpha/beta fold hydrolase [Fictibacillus phosphorivorans]|uniref:alpha/beta fold hydrolase n=1 Tax=Fictibacillus phosphorivorans TaxID=1221500 RepID=UPI00203DC706|nr:alpha/beta hydrolase [Fictibacillus phosphorivorans]MCM3718739.1 alpha/beta hydrolase [Fictibacillus phosphorivorans]MCM3776362.1 alpha/beta hydrolase [Fictibacillus phosphorivorans]
MAVNNQHPFVPGYRLNVNNVDVYYEYFDHENPDAKVIVLVHGFLSSTISFRKLLPDLTKEFKVIALDLPGFGQSEKSTTFIYKLSNYGQLIIDFLDKLNVQEAILIGHSMGGQISLHAAKIAPERIKKLILLGCCSYVKRASRSLIACSYLPLFTWGMKSWIKKKDVKQNLLAVLHDSKLVTQEMIDGYSKPLNEAAFIHCLVRLLRHREGDMSSEELKKITQPVLMIWGKEDKVIPLKTGYKLKHDLPNAELVVYEKCGHLVMEEKPKEITNEILRFIGQPERMTYEIL